MFIKKPAGYYRDGTKMIAVMAGRGTDEQDALKAFATDAGVDVAKVSAQLNPELLTGVTEIGVWSPAPMRPAGLGRSGGDNRTRDGVAATEKLFARPAFKAPELPKKAADPIDYAKLRTGDGK